MAFGRKDLETVIGTKVDMSMIKNQDMVFSIGLLVMSIREIMIMISGMDMVKCFGLMEASIKVNGKMEFKKDKVYVQVCR